MWVSPSAENESGRTLGGGVRPLMACARWGENRDAAFDHHLSAGQWSADGWMGGRGSAVGRYHDKLLLPM